MEFGLLANLVIVCKVGRCGCMSLNHGYVVVRGAAPYVLSEYVYVGCVPRTMKFGSLANLVIVCKVGRCGCMSMNYGYVVVRGAAPYVLSEYIYVGCVVVVFGASIV